jgi:type I restriction enzyme, R subunit
LNSPRRTQQGHAPVGFVRLCSFLSQIMPFTDVDLERLHTFARHLELKLPHDPRNAPLDLDGDVALKYYRIDKITDGGIRLSVAEPMPLRGPTDLCTRTAKDEEAALSEVIDILNERFGTNFTPADQLLFDQFVVEAKQNEDVVQKAKVNLLDNFEHAMKPVIEGLMIDRMARTRRS